MEATPDMSGTTIVTLLDDATARLHAAGVDAPRRNAELLLGDACRLDRSALYLRLQSSIDSASVARFSENLARRLDGFPLQYIRGHQEFWSLDFDVTPATLIPRPETELLIEQALDLAGSGPVCDVGTGSGCIAITLAHELPALRATAIDISAAALTVAQANATRLGVSDRLRFVCSDLFGAAADERFELIVSNPPYVESGAIDAGQRELAFEPRHALDGGADGLDVIRRLIPAAVQRLLPGGWLLVEIGSTQEKPVLELARHSGGRDPAVLRDYAGLPRLLRARW